MSVRYLKRFAAGAAASSGAGASEFCRVSCSPGFAIPGAVYREIASAITQCRRQRHDGFRCGMHVGEVLLGAPFKAAPDRHRLAQQIGGNATVVRQPDVDGGEVGARHLERIF